MSDIVERLRQGIKSDDGNPEIGRPPSYAIYSIMTEAADEIERLRELLGAAAKTPESKTFRDMKDRIMSGMAKDLDDHG